MIDKISEMKLRCLELATDNIRVKWNNASVEQVAAEYYNWITGEKEWSDFGQPEKSTAAIN